MYCLVFDLRGWVGVHPVHAALEDKITAQVPPPFQLLRHIVIHLVPATKKFCMAALIERDK